MYPTLPLLSPPYYLVAFTSQRPVEGPEDGYAQMAEHIHSLAKDQPGFLGINSVRGADGHGITLSYWQSETDIRHWKQHPEHQQAQLTGRSRWYEAYRIEVCRVERAYSFSGVKGETIDKN